jgi:tetratricopeptide (TPR) repeat protein
MKTLPKRPKTESVPSGLIARGKDIAQAYGEHATASVTHGLTPEQLQAALHAAGEAQQRTVENLSRKLETTQEAVRGFLSVLSDSEVPLERLPQTLAEIAQRHRDMLQRLSALNPEDPAIKAKIEDAREILTQASSAAAYDRADALLAEAEESDVQAIREAEALEQEAREAVERKRQSAAATRTERGELSLTRLDYLQAAQHFKAAADFVVGCATALRAEYLNRYAVALCRYGDEKGDNAVLTQAIGVLRDSLKEFTQERAQLDWAMTQNNLGNALRSLGERESGTARLEEAVAAYREALKERTWERVPLDWARTQNNLGNALAKLGERERGTVRLEEALRAIESARSVYREAGLLQYETYFEARAQPLRQLITRRSAHYEQPA